ncbi:MAG: S-adenosylmethionine:tRNA ribosyltransferase-isomerase, partial [Candidatus Neoclostridium sp.]
MKKSDFYYDLPEELIAQHPAEPRDSARLLVYHKDSGKIEDKHFYDIVDYLMPGDVLVVNDTKVIPARIYGHRDVSGGKIEFLLHKRIDLTDWEVLAKPARKALPGNIIR